MVVERASRAVRFYPVLKFIPNILIGSRIISTFSEISTVETKMLLFILLQFTVF